MPIQHDSHDTTPSEGSPLTADCQKRKRKTKRSCYAWPGFHILFPKHLLLLKKQYWAKKMFIWYSMEVLTLLLHIYIGTHTHNIHTIGKATLRNSMWGEERDNRCFQMIQCRFAPNPLWKMSIFFPGENWGKDLHSSMCTEHGTFELSHVMHSCGVMAFSFLGGQRVSKNSSVGSKPLPGPAIRGGGKQTFSLGSFTDTSSYPFEKGRTSERGVGHQRVAPPRRQNCSLEDISW